MFANFLENEYKIVRNTKKTKPRLKNKEATKLRLQRRQYGINLGFPATRNLGFPATIIFFFFASSLKMSQKEFIHVRILSLMYVV